jgi:hypothetical protein
VLNTYLLLVVAVLLVMVVVLLQVVVVLEEHTVVLQRLFLGQHIPLLLLVLVVLHTLVERVGLVTRV